MKFIDLFDAAQELQDFCDKQGWRSVDRREVFPDVGLQNITVLRTRNLRLSQGQMLAVSRAGKRS